MSDLNDDKQPKMPKSMQVPVSFLEG